MADEIEPSLPVDEITVAPSGNGRGCMRSDDVESQNLSDRYPAVIVRYGYMKYVGEFSFNKSDSALSHGDAVVVQTPRGIELGEVLGKACLGCPTCINRDQITSYVDASGPDYYAVGVGRVLRPATEGDKTDWERMKAETPQKRAICQRMVDQHQLPMKVVDCEHLLGGERIVFYFLADGRVDFRALVRELASEFQTRIEMRQVGARDEARLLADFETCGRECCCRGFLKSLKPISMKMAKMQKATLDPAKVSGRCGRLKCCLRYEHSNYEELDKALPQVGARVATDLGHTGVIVARQILTQLLRIQTADGGCCVVGVEQLIDEQELQRRMEQKAKEAAEAEAERKEAESRKDEKRRAEDTEPAKQRGNRGRRRRSKPGNSSENQAEEKNGNVRVPEANGEKDNSSDGAKKRRKRRRPPRRRGGKAGNGGESQSPPSA